MKKHNLAKRVMISILSLAMAAGFAMANPVSVQAAKPSPETQTNPTVEAMDIDGWWMKDSVGYWFKVNRRNPNQRSMDRYLEDQWLEYNNKYYYFGYDGYMKTGWVLYEGNWYHLDHSGAMNFGWYNDGGTWYFLDTATGIMRTGWQRLAWAGGTSWFFFSGTGAMQTGWQFIGGRYYFFNGNGVMRTGWANIDGEWYFFNNGTDNVRPLGAMRTGWFTDGNTGKNYFFKYKTGVMARNEQLMIRGQVYTFNASGVLVRGNTPLP